MQVDPNDAQAELTRVLGSKALQRSERLQKFLRYVCERTLDGQAEAINEYAVATEVFGRSEDFVPGQDALVRSRAHTLRQKLKQYYEDEGRENPFRIDLPLGRYVPIFSATQTESIDADLAEPTPNPVNEQQPTPWRVRLVALVAGAVGLVALGWHLGASEPRQVVVPVLSSATQQKTSFTIDPNVERIWGDWIAAGEVTVCIGHPKGLAVWPYRRPPPDPESWHVIKGDTDKRRRLIANSNLEEGADSLYVTIHGAYAEVGEAQIGFVLSQFFGALGVKVRVRRADEMTWDQFRSQNVVVVGTEISNKWVAPLMKGQPMQTGLRGGTASIAPLDGIHDEPKTFRSQFSGWERDYVEQYAVVSMLPGMARGRKVLLIAGTNMSMGVAGDLLTDAQRLREIAAQLPDDMTSPAFQFALRTHGRDNTPTQTEIIEFRTLEE